MAAGRIVGSIVEIWRFPVQSMQWEPLKQVELEERGVLGDRAKSVRRFPNLLECRATFVEPPGLSALSTQLGLFHEYLSAVAVAGAVMVTLALVGVLVFGSAIR